MTPGMPSLLRWTALAGLAAFGFVAVSARRGGGACATSPLPDDGRLDSTVALLRQGYAFIPSRCRSLHSDAFRTRLMGTPALCVRGEDAARMFYAPDRFTRRGAVPFTTLALLQGRGSVQTLDGPAHRHRKALFLDVLASAHVATLVTQFETEWRAAMPGWTAAGRIVLHDAARRVLCRAVCAWAGVPLTPAEADARTDEFGAMIDGAGRVGPKNWRGQWRRARTERWAGRLIDDVRAGRRQPPPDTALARIAHHRELDGTLLDRRTAAIELINVLRPTVAVARFVVFGALALHQHPSWRARLAVDDDAVRAFAEEVRRATPFFPAVGGRALAPFTWRGHEVAAGDWVLLDLYGSNHDRHTWRDPAVFRPERFLTRPADAFAPIPQGGGFHDDGHRCAGEGATIALLEAALRLLTREMRYRVPAQDCRVRLDQVPALPASGLVLADVSRRS